MDGGEDEDGSTREYVEITPAVEQPHISRERHRAAAENREPMLGSAAYRNLSLTGPLDDTGGLESIGTGILLNWEKSFPKLITIF